MQNNFNPYGYNYAYPNYNQPQQRTNRYEWVNGYEGAKAFQVQPNQSVMLLDSDEPIIYKKDANEYGQATIKAFKMVPIDNSDTNTINDEKYVLKADFEALVKRIDEMSKKEEA